MYGSSVLWHSEKTVCCPAYEGTQRKRGKVGLVVAPQTESSCLEGGKKKEDVLLIINVMKKALH